MRSAAHADADIAALLRQDQERRYAGQTAFVKMIADRGPLRDGITTDEATDIYWSLSSPELYTLLTVERNWTPEHFEMWLAHSLVAMLLTDPQARV